MFVRRELSNQAAADGQETFEEADDFDVDDEPADPTTPWELNFDQEAAGATYPADGPPSGVPQNSVNPDPAGAGIPPASPPHSASPAA